MGIVEIEDAGKGKIFFYCCFIFIDHGVLFVICLFENSELPESGERMKGLLPGEREAPINLKSLQEKRD